MAASTPVADRVMALLAQITQTDEILQAPDLRLYDLHILDSLLTVELIVALSEQLGVEISPAELDREEWATPRQIVAYVEARVRG